MKILLDNPVLKIGVITRESENAVLCFTGIGHLIGGVDVQSEEFFRVSSNATAIFIVDKQRSWGNNFDFRDLVQVIAPYIKDKTLYAIGNSMGGFLAILASRFLTITAVVAFVPQFTVSKRIIPTENRWDEYVQHIHHWRYESLHGAFHSRTRYYVFFGLDAHEEKQVALFPAQENVGIVIFKSADFVHTVAQTLKKQGVLYNVIQDCFALKPVEQIIASHFQASSREAYARRGRRRRQEINE